VGVVGAWLLLYARPAQAGRERIHEVRRWAYQLQGDLPASLSPDIDCVVVDADAATRQPRTAAQVRALKRRPGRPDRIVLAYLSIGEAEDYRAYWKAGWRRAPPSFLAPENRHWKGNYKVRYWEPEWQAIVLDLVTRVIGAQFDGVYLDVIDAFEYFAPDGPRPERKTSAEDMARLVVRIAEHARAARGMSQFLVVPQNGANLLERVSPEQAKAYLQAVDAIGVEDVFFYGRRRENNPLNPQKEILASLSRFVDAGKTVLSIEYLTEPKKVAAYLHLARGAGFVPTIAPRSLDRMLALPE
jgi:cysteinyl-tRNA synthetase